MTQVASNQWSRRLALWVAGSSPEPARSNGSTGLADSPNPPLCLDELLAPTPSLIRKVRTEAGLNQLEAARSVGCSHAARWCEYESGGVRMTVCKWELFLLKTGRHPLALLRMRSKTTRPAVSPE